MLQHPLNGACLTIALLSCSFFAAPAAAQDPTDPATLHVTLVKTKPGKSAAWRDLQRDVLPRYYKSAEWPWVSVYGVRFGEASYAVITDVANLDLTTKMSDADLRRYQETLSDSVEWTRTYVQYKLTELSFGAPEEKPAAHVSVSNITIAPDKRAEFIKTFKESLIPRWKKMGIPFVTTWEILYGENSGQFIVLAPLETYAALNDGTPYFRGLSEAELGEMMRGMQGVTVKIERNVGDYLEDLSYRAGQ
jgi:hypothetical protein